MQNGNNFMVLKARKIPAYTRQDPHLTILSHSATHSTSVSNSPKSP